MYVFEFAYSCNIYMYVCTIYIDIHKFTYISLHMSHACIWSYVSSHEYFSSSIQKQKRYRDEITCGSEAESITGSPSRSRRRVEGGGKPVNCMIFVNIEILVQWIRHDRRIICIRVECRPYIKILFFPVEQYHVDIPHEVRKFPGNFPRSLGTFSTPLPYPHPRNPHHTLLRSPPPNLHMHIDFSRNYNNHTIQLTVFHYLQLTTTVVLLQWAQFHLYVVKYRLKVLTLLMEKQLFLLFYQPLYQRYTYTGVLGLTHQLSTSMSSQIYYPLTRLG